MAMSYPSDMFLWSGEYRDYVERCRLVELDAEAGNKSLNGKERIMRKADWCESTEALINTLKDCRMDHLVDVVKSWADLMTKDGKLDYPVLLGLAVYGEARGESALGQIAISEVLFNRYQDTNVTLIEQVLLSPLQFSCLNRGNKTLNDAMNCDYHEVYRYCSQAGIVLACCNRVRSRVLKPDTTLYMSEAAWKRIALRWAQQKDDAWDITRLKPRGQIDRHIFFAE